MQISFDNVNTLYYNNNEVSKLVLNNAVVWTKQSSGERSLNYIKFTQGGYIDTDIQILPTDRFYMKFKITDSIPTWVLGRSHALQSGSTILHYYRLFIYINSYGELVMCGTRNNSSNVLNSLISNTNFMSLNTIYELDFNLNSTNLADYTINGSNSWINTSRSNISNKPNNFYQNYTLYLNNHNCNGQPISELNGTVQPNSMTLYEFKLYDSSGNVKCDLQPVLKDGTPMFKDVTNSKYLNISAVTGYTPTITYG